MAHIVWNGARSVGIILNFPSDSDSSALAYELRKGSDSNTLGLMRDPSLMAGWAEFTCEDNNTTEQVDLLASCAEPVVSDRTRYLASELAGAMEEYLGMPCSSLRARMRQSLERYQREVSAEQKKL